MPSGMSNAFGGVDLQAINRRGSQGSAGYRAVALQVAVVEVQQGEVAIGALAAGATYNIVDAYDGIICAIVGRLCPRGIEAVNGAG